MHRAEFPLIADLVEDASNGWSIGSFGAIGEFMRDADEAAAIERSADFIEVVTARGGMRAVAADLQGVAWDSLSADGESWGHSLAFCLHPEPRAAVEEALSALVRRRMVYRRPHRSDHCLWASSSVARWLAEPLPAEP